MLRPNREPVKEPAKEPLQFQARREGEGGREGGRGQRERDWREREREGERPSQVTLLRVLSAIPIFNDTCCVRTYMHTTQGYYYVRRPCTP